MQVFKEIRDNVFNAALDAGIESRRALTLAQKAERRAILMEVRKELSRLLVIKGGKPVGAISERKDGKYKKYGPGDWRLVTDDIPSDETKKRDSENTKTTKLLEKDYIETSNGNVKIPEKVKTANENEIYTEKEINTYNLRYEKGKELAEKRKKYDSDSDFYYSLNESDLSLFANLGPTNMAFFMSGFEGRDKPKFSTGWRYGKAPEEGRSKNYAEDKMEDGISFMETRDSDKIKGTYELFNSENQKPVFYAGYEIPKKGSDGEPLMVGVKEIK